MTPASTLSSVTSSCDRLLASLVQPDGRLAWSSHLLDTALASTAAANGGSPEPLFERAWAFLAGRALDENAYEFCRALGRAALASYRAARWDLAWMISKLVDAEPAQRCLAYWTLALRADLWNEQLERETLAVLRAYPFAW